jgi:hypothetical protein
VEHEKNWLVGCASKLGLHKLLVLSKKLGVELDVTGLVNA